MEALLPVQQGPLQATAPNPGTKAQLDAMKQEMFSLNKAGKVKEAVEMRKRVKQLEASLASSGVAEMPPSGQPMQRSAAAPPPSRSAQAASAGPDDAAEPPTMDAVARALAQAQALLVDPTDGPDDELDDDEDPSLLGGRQFFSAFILFFGVLIPI